MKRAFTLIELLVVVALIVILAGTLYPVLNSVKERAKQAKCIANLKQIGLSLRMYVDDHDGTFPPYWDDWFQTYTPEYPNRGYWHNLLRPYGLTNSLLQCPSDPPRPLDDGEGIGEERFAKFGFGSGSYGYNYYYLGVDPANLTNESKLKDCSTTIAISEMTRKIHGAVIYPPPNAQGMPNWQNSVPSSAERERRWKNFGSQHNEGANAVYCDGHAGYAKTKFYFDHPELFYDEK